uniref:Uncharacterized protein n=1 Tax=Timema bartmani TaxID=61472 RepID=A0A7R9F798_9NEOP|nr:unnamed protein product [Timema bartmani]
MEGSQLLVIHNGWIAESVCLLTANHLVRGIWRHNSLLMLVRHQLLAEDIGNVSAKFPLEDSLIVALLNPELVQLSEEIIKLFKNYH